MTNLADVLRSAYHPAGREVGAMNRRGFVTGLGAVLAAPRGVEAQQAQIPTIGVLTLAVAPSTPTLQAFRDGLSEHGYVVGKNIAVEYRFADGSVDKLRAMAAELVRKNVDVIVIESVLAAQEAKRATDTIPIVTAVHGDPVGAGLAATLTRPGGNVTGLSLLAPELSGKRLQLLKEMIPKAVRVAVIWNPTNVAAARYLSETRTAGRSLGLQVEAVEARAASDFDAAFDAVVATRPSAFITLADGMLLANKARIVEFATRSRIPALFPDQEFASAGGLIAYGPSLAANFRRAASYVDRILKGAKPAELPVEQPSKFEMTINMKTAKALGLTIPPSLLLRADQLIE
jgi:putative tryptophan/tyrosine transport system substrate-binding protein